MISRHLRWCLPVDPQHPVLPGRLPAPHDGVDRAVLVLLVLMLMLLLLLLLLLVVVGMLALVRGLPHHLRAAALRLG